MADLRLTIYAGEIPAKDLFSCDPYVSVTVAAEKARTPVDTETTSPQWDWEHVFTYVAPDSRITFHVHDEGTGGDDDLGRAEMTVARFLEGNEDKRQTVRTGDSAPDVMGTWV
ncbi:C2 domain-containing protein [Streptomyces sp. NBC_00467]|uniref:C2 domain-containing protein n=1 Tax=Streptomyces sp. NBC_00467 TaxID=2975752 RepID=UPI002E19063A